MNRRAVCVAPMMEWTDRHYRYLARLMTKYSYLYTEMITSAALVHGDRDRFLSYNHSEHPVALQLGGSDPAEMAQSANWGQIAGYDEININVGCPSDRVQSGRFGVCLMREPEQVAQCVSVMQKEVDIPITVKCRIGVDHDDSYEFLTKFIQTVKSAGCNIFILHARKALLKGLSPKQNREIPELNYERVYTLKNDFPELDIIVNGGIETTKQINNHLQHVDGVMVGRQAYQHPQFLLNIDREIFNDENASSQTIREIILKYTEYMEDNIRIGIPLKSMAKHILNLYQGVPGAKQWRRHLSENMHKSDVGIELIHQGLEKVNF